MKEFIEHLAVLITILLFFAFWQFCIGTIFGIVSGPYWNEDDMRGKEICDEAHKKPQSYLGHLFYSVKHGQRVGCFLIEPKFNLKQ